MRKKLFILIFLLIFILFSYVDIIAQITPGGRPAMRKFSVSNIDDPSSVLSEKKGLGDGDVVVIYEQTGSGDEITLYSWSSESIVQNIPYIVTGSSGTWKAVAGKYIYGANINNGSNNISNILLVDPDSTEILGKSYNKVQSAIDYLVGETDNWIIKIKRGVYNESLSLTSSHPTIYFVADPILSSRNIAVSIFSDDNSEYSLDLVSNDSSFLGIGFYPKSVFSSVGLIEITDSSPAFINCHLYFDLTGSDIDEMFEINYTSAGVLFIYDCFIEASDVDLIFDFNDSANTASIRCFNTYIKGSNDSANYLLDNQSPVAFFHHLFLNCIFEDYPKLLPTGLDVPLKNCVYTENTATGDGTLNNSYTTTPVVTSILFDDYCQILGVSGYLNVRNAADDGYNGILANYFNTATGVVRTNSNELQLIADNDGGGTGVVGFYAEDGDKVGQIADGGDVTLYGDAGNTPSIYFDVAADADVTLLEVEDSSGNGTLTWNSSQDRFDFSDKVYAPSFIAGYDITNYAYGTPTTITLFSSETLMSMKTNHGSTDAVTFNLPDASRGLSVTFYVSAAQNVTINPKDGDQIQGYTSDPGDAIQGTSQMDCVTLVGIDTTYWVVTNVIGTWSDVD